MLESAISPYYYHHHHHLPSVMPSQRQLNSNTKVPAEEMSGGSRSSSANSRNSAERILSYKDYLSSSREASPRDEDLAALSHQPVSSYSSLPVAQGAANLERFHPSAQLAAAVLQSQQQNHGLQTYQNDTLMQNQLAVAAPNQLFQQLSQMLAVQQQQQQQQAPQIPRVSPWPLVGEDVKTCPSCKVMFQGSDTICMRCIEAFKKEHAYKNYVKQQLLMEQQQQQLRQQQDLQYLKSVSDLDNILNQINLGQQSQQAQMRDEIGFGHIARASSSLDFQLPGRNNLLLQNYGGSSSVLADEVSNLNHLAQSNQYQLQLIQQRQQFQQIQKQLSNSSSFPRRITKQQEINEFNRGLHRQMGARPNPQPVSTDDGFPVVDHFVSVPSSKLNKNVDKDKKLRLPAKNSEHVTRKPVDSVELFGGFGTEDCKFSEPSGVCTDESGNIYVADSNNNRVSIFTTNGEYLRRVGKVNDGRGAPRDLQFPNRVAVCPKTKNIVIMQRKPNAMVLVFKPDGEYLYSIASECKMVSPRGVVVDKEGRIIILESHNQRRILIFTPSRRILNEFSLNELPFPISLDVNEHNEIFVADNTLHCVKVFSYEGKILRSIGVQGEINYPVSVIIGINGEVIISDNHNNFNITIYDRFGNRISALESDKKHNQCYDAALTPDYHIVMSTKDFAIYKLRLPVEALDPKNVTDYFNMELYEMNKKVMESKNNNSSSDENNSGRSSRANDGSDYLNEWQIGTKNAASQADSFNRNSVRVGSVNKNYSSMMSRSGSQQNSVLNSQFFDSRNQFAHWRNSDADAVAAITSQSHSLDRMRDICGPNFSETSSYRVPRDNLFESNAVNSNQPNVDDARARNDLISLMSGLNVAPSIDRNQQDHGGFGAVGGRYLLSTQETSVPQSVWPLNTYSSLQSTGPSQESIERAARAAWGNPAPIQPPSRSSAKNWLGELVGGKDGDDTEAGQSRLI